MAMICKSVIESILLSGILLVLAQISITIKPSAAIHSTEYAGIILPGEIIDGWQQAAVDHYMFERMQLIGHNHPDDRYLSLKLFWPKEVSPYIRVGKITFFKCINRTPAIAKTLMHIIRGGIGTSELALEVIYAPVQRALINTLIISCDIYVETSYPDENEDDFSTDLFKVNIPDTMRTEISAIGTTARRTSPMVDVPSVISKTTIHSQAILEGMAWKSEGPVGRNEGERLFDSEIGPMTNLAESHTETAGQRTGETVAYTESTASKINAETTLTSFEINEESLKTNYAVSEDEKPRRTSLGESQNINATPAGIVKLKDIHKKLFANRTNSMKNTTSFRNKFISETTYEITDDSEETTLKMNLQTIPSSRKTNLKITATSLQTSGESLRKDCEDSENERTSKIDSEAMSQDSEESVHQSDKTATTNRETQATWKVKKPHGTTSWNGEFDIQKIDMRTLYIGTTTPKIDQTIVSDYRTTLAANEIHSQANRLILGKNCGCNQNEPSSNKEKNDMKSMEKMSNIKSLKTPGGSSRDSHRSRSMNVVTPEKSETENLSGIEGIEEPVTSALYNLVVNARSKGSRRKMNLAKITYR